MITFRPASTADLSMVLSCRVREPVSWVDPGRYQRELAVGSYRPEWTWLAQYDGVLVGRAVWWALPDRTSPTALDCLWTSPTVGDRASVAADLLRAGHAGLRDGGATSLPDYEIDLEPGWRQDAARRAGLTHTLERLSYAWTPSNPVPASSPRLLFNEEPDDHRFLALFAETAQGSLDDLTRRTLAALGTEAQARDDLGFYLGLPGERDRWRGSPHHRGGPRRARAAHPHRLGRQRWLPRSPARAPRLRLRHRPARQDNPPARPPRRPQDHRHHRRHQHTHGSGLRPRRLRPHRHPARAVPTTVTTQRTMSTIYDVGRQLPPA